MNLQITASKSATITVADLTPVTGASVSLSVSASGTLGGGAPFTFDPADAFAIGDALKDAARKAGFTPNP